MRKRKTLLATSVSIALSSWAGSASSAGFALIEQSVSNMGTGYAGGAAHASDTSTLYFNPAGMTRLEGTHASAALHLIKPSTKFSDGGSTFAPALGGAPMGGGNGGDAGGWAAVPHTYVSHQLSDNAWLGFAINAPFGLTTEYDPTWVGRYHAVKSAIKTINLNPSVAFRASDDLSIGIGVSAQFLEAELSNAVDFAGVNATLAGGAMPFSAVPGTADGMVRIEGDSWGFGANLGILYEPNKDTRVGLHFRSEVKHDVQGTADFSGAVQPIVEVATGGAFADSRVSSDVTLPATASISIFHQATSELAVMADYTWTGWSSIPELRFDFVNPLQPAGITTFNWRDTYRVAIGAEYQPNSSRLTYRLGAAYDQSPIDNDAFRTPRLPDEDRIWLTLGVGYQWSEDIKLDFGYAHLFIDDPVLNKNDTAPGGEDFLRGALSGSYDSSVDILAAQLEMRFN